MNMHINHEPMRSRRLRVWRVREVARFLCVRQSEVWSLTHDSDSGFPAAYYIAPSTFVWDQDAVEEWDRRRRAVRRAGLSALRDIFA
jgi:predicted DNA-binding transcriptional regulator AlpA